MMQSEILQEAPWSFCNDMNSTFDQLSYGINMDAHVGDYGLSSLFSTPEDNSHVSPIPFSSNDHFQYLLDDDNLQLLSSMDDLPMDWPDWDAFDPNLYAENLGIFRYSEESEGSLSNAQIVGNLGYTEGSEGSFPSVHFASDELEACSPSSSMKSEVSAVQPLLSLPQEDMEIDHQLSVLHLLEAHGKALELGQKTLAEVILRCLGHKFIPLGNALERLAFYLPQDTSTQGHFIKQEASKNLELAFKACYQGLPHGKVSHFTANSAILQAIPEDSEAIHIVDYDIGSGVQWPPMIEAIAQQGKTLKLTSIKLEDDKSECLSTPWKFEETKRHLYEHAKSFGLNLKVEETTIEELVMDLKKMNKRGGRRREWIAFNCQVGLTHMGRERSRTHVMEFLKVAKDLIKNTANRGIVILGDGDAYEKVKNCINFKSFFDGHLEHYQALLESIESNFPKHLSEARLAIECLFVAPYISSGAWLQKWEKTQGNGHLQTEIGLEDHRLSKGILNEIREMLRGCAGPYEAKIEGQNENEIVLEWRGIQLVRVSIWGN